MASTEVSAAALTRKRRDSIAVAVEVVEVACPTSAVGGTAAGDGRAPAVVSAASAAGDEGEMIITDATQLPTYLSPWTLTFRSREIEDEYLRARLPLLLRTLRLCLWAIFVVVWVLFFAAYFNLWSSNNNDIYARVSFFYIAGAGAAIVLQFMSYTHWFKERLIFYTWLLLTPCAALLGVLLFVPRGMANEGAVSSGLCLALVGFVLCMERFRYISAVLWAYIVAYIVQVAVWSDNNTSQLVTLFVPIIAVGFFPCMAAWMIDKRSRLLWLSQRSVDERNASLCGEKEQMERLLRYQLPESIIAKLKGNENRRSGFAMSNRFESVTVAFVELYGWHDVMRSVDPGDAVAILNAIFTRFDSLVEQSGSAIEKIKTTGSLYMVASGVPNPVEDHAGAVAEWALRLLADWRSGKTRAHRGLDIKIGMHSGEVVGGIVGDLKFCYDIYGDTVNTASRMCKAGTLNQIQCTRRVEELLQSTGRFVVEFAGLKEFKGKGTLETFLVVRRVTDPDPALVAEAADEVDGRRNSTPAPGEVAHRRMSRNSFNVRQRDSGSFTRLSKWFTQKGARPSVSKSLTTHSLAVKSFSDMALNVSGLKKAPAHRGSPKLPKRHFVHAEPLKDAPSQSHSPARSPSASSRAASDGGNNRPPDTPPSVGSEASDKAWAEIEGPYAPRGPDRRPLRTSVQEAMKRLAMSLESLTSIGSNDDSDASPAGGSTKALPAVAASSGAASKGSKGSRRASASALSSPARSKSGSLLERAAAKLAVMGPADATAVTGGTEAVLKPSASTDVIAKPKQPIRRSASENDVAFLAVESDSSIASVTASEIDLRIRSGDASGSEDEVPLPEPMGMSAESTLRSASVASQRRNEGAPEVSVTAAAPIPEDAKEDVDAVAASLASSLSHAALSRMHSMLRRESAAAPISPQVQRVHAEFQRQQSIAAMEATSSSAGAAADGMESPAQKEEEGSGAFMRRLSASFSSPAVLEADGAEPRNAGRRMSMRTTDAIFHRRDAVNKVLGRAESSLVAKLLATKPNRWTLRFADPALEAAFGRANNYRTRRISLVHIVAAWIFLTACVAIEIASDMSGTRKAILICVRIVCGTALCGITGAILVGKARVDGCFVCCGATWELLGSCFRRKRAAPRLHDGETHVSHERLDLSSVGSEGEVPAAIAAPDGIDRIKRKSMPHMGATPVEPAPARRVLSEAFRANVVLVIFTSLYIMLTLGLVLGSGSFMALDFWSPAAMVQYLDIILVASPGISLRLQTWLFTAFAAAAIVLKAFYPDEYSLFSLLVGLIGMIIAVGTQYLFERHERKQFILDAVAVEQEKEIREEKLLGEQLLHNILPPSIARMLSEQASSSTARQFDAVTVLAMDIAGFTLMSSEMAASDVVFLLNSLFNGFDALVRLLGVEKICTIGDAYVAASGAPEPCADHAERTCRLGVEMLRVVAMYNAAHRPRRPVQVRIGVHTGTCVAGILGGKIRFKYDLYGDAVYVASSLEQSGQAGCVHISRTTADVVDLDRLAGSHRMVIDACDAPVRVTVSGVEMDIATVLVHPARVKITGGHRLDASHNSHHSNNNPAPQSAASSRMTSAMSSPHF